jgi:hypothetical protein
MLKRVAVGRNAVGRGHRTQAADKFVGARIAHHANGADGQQHGKGLPDFVIEAGLADFVEIDRIGLAQDFDPIARNSTGNADRQPRAGERVAAD